MEQVFPSSEQDRRFLLEFVDACHTHPVTQFQQAVYPKLRHLLPHDMFMYGDTDALSNITQYVNVSFPQQYIDQVSAPYGSLVCPLAGRWTGALRPLYYNPCQAGRFVTRSKRYETLCDLSIGDIAIHGVPGCQTLRGSDQADLTLPREDDVFFCPSMDLPAMRTGQFAALNFCGGPQAFFDRLTARG